MNDPYSTNSQCQFALTVALLVPILASLAAAQENAKSDRVQIGEVLGKPIYRDDIRPGVSLLKDELSRLFIAPLIIKYRQEHKAEIEPTPEEIDATTVQIRHMHEERMKRDGPSIREQLAAVNKKLDQPGLSAERQRELEAWRDTFQNQLIPPGRDVAVLLLDPWKFQRHLYDRFGGGRMLGQTFGLEVFDAMHNWLLAQEAAGEFKINDPKLRASFYHHWTTQDHGLFLHADKELIRSGFLEPEWYRKQ